MININTDKNSLYVNRIIIYTIFNMLFIESFVLSNFQNKWIEIVALNILITLIFLIIGYLDSIRIIDDKNIQLIYKKWLTKIKIKEYPVNQLKYTYKIEAISKGVNGNTLRLYFADKKILKIYVNKNGWTEDKLDELVKNLDNFGIQRKFTGYSLKDVYPF